MDEAEQMQLRFQQQAQQERAEAAAQFMHALNAGIHALGARLFCTLALLGAIAFFGVAIAMPDQFRIVTACLYAVLVLLPVFWLGRRFS